MYFYQVIYKHGKPQFSQALFSGCVLTVNYVIVSVQKHAITVDPFTL